MGWVTEFFDTQQINRLVDLDGHLYGVRTQDIFLLHISLGGIYEYDREAILMWAP